MATGEPETEEAVMKAVEHKPVPKVRNFRITENASLHGLVVRERGELIEYVSYNEARIRLKHLTSHAA